MPNSRKWLAECQGKSPNISAPRLRLSALSQFLAVGEAGQPRFAYIQDFRLPRSVSRTEPVFYTARQPAKK
jgi:hypothetical protein